MTSRWVRTDSILPRVQHNSSYRVTVPARKDIFRFFAYHVLASFFPFTSSSLKVSLTSSSSARSLSMARRLRCSSDSLSTKMQSPDIFHIPLPHSTLFHLLILRTINADPDIPFGRVALKRHICHRLAVLTSESLSFFSFPRFPTVDCLTARGVCANTSSETSVV